VVKVYVEARNDETSPGYVKLQGETWELNVWATTDDLWKLTDIEATDWSQRRLGSVRCSPACDRPQSSRRAGGTSGEAPAALGAHALLSLPTSGRCPGRAREESLTLLLLSSARSPCWRVRVARACGFRWLGALASPLQSLAARAEPQACRSPRADQAVTAWPLHGLVSPAESGGATLPARGSLLPLGLCQRRRRNGRQASSRPRPTPRPATRLKRSGFSCSQRPELSAVGPCCILLPLQVPPHCRKGCNLRPYRYHVRVVNCLRVIRQLIRGTCLPVDVRQV
jgi:hypothetical protein